MRGILSILLAIILVLIFVMIALFGFAQARGIYEREEPKLGITFGVLRPYTFDINSLLVGPDEGMNKSQYDAYYWGGPFCAALKGCIIKSITEGGSWCLVNFSKYKSPPIGPDEVSPASAIGGATALGGCPTQHLFEKVSGVEREVCYFRSGADHAIGSSKLFENDSQLVAYQPYFHGCFVPAEMKGEANKVWHICDGTQPEKCKDTKYYLPDGGWAAIYVAAAPNASDPLHSCVLNITTCGQRAIGTDISNMTVTIFELMRDLSRELTCAEWNDAEKTCQLGGEGWLGHYPHFNQYNLTGKPKPSKSAVLAAVDAGMWEWSKRHLTDTSLIRGLPAALGSASGIRFSYAPWKEETSSRSCDAEIENTAKNRKPGQPEFVHVKAGADFGNANYLRIAIGVRKVFADIKSGEEPERDVKGSTSGRQGCGPSPFTDFCEVGWLCVDQSSGGWCCPPDAPSYYKADKSCRQKDIELIPTVVVCTCTKEDCK